VAGIPPTVRVFAAFKKDSILRVVIPQKIWEELTVYGAGLPGALAISQDG